MEQLLRQMEPLWGEWYLEHPLGSGAWGDVWQIRRENERAALKTIYIEMKMSTEAQLRFEGIDQNGYTHFMESIFQQASREYEMMRLFEGDPHILQCQDALSKTFRQNDRIEYLLLIRMEKLVDLWTHLQETELTVPEVIRIGIHICRALESCAERNILHRDVAPKNIFYDSGTDSYKLGDFGMADWADEDHEMPEKAGTYTAPEVFNDNAFSPLSDEYSLGLILYRMINDFRLPFQSLYPENYTRKDRSRALFRRLKGEMPPMPRVVRKYSISDPAGMTGLGATVTASTSDLARRLADVIMRAVHPLPEERYPSAAAFRRALEDLL